MYKVECYTCHKSRAVGLIVDDKPYCPTCAKKVKPIAEIFHIAQDGCECGEEGIVFQVRIDGDSSMYCMDCLTAKLEELAGTSTN